MSLVPPQASSFAAEIDFIIVLIAILGGFWLILAEAVLFYFIFRFRAKKGEKSQYITGETKEESKWIHWPHNLVLICDVFILFFAIKTWYGVKQELPPADLTIKVRGMQWSWVFTHPGEEGQLGTPQDVETVDELHLVEGKTYHFLLESGDVIHSFSIPAFRLKQDAIPGRVITGWFKPTLAGQYDIQCAEICGIGHGIMKSRLTVESEDDYKKWLAAKRATFAQN